MTRINKKLLQFFSVLADETRLKILVGLMNSPRSVNEIHNQLGKDNLTLSAVSHQLKQLDDLGIVFYDRRGREKHFQLSDDFCWCILKDALGHFDKNCKCKSCLASKQEVLKMIK